MSLITIRDPRNLPASRYSTLISDQRWTPPRLLLSGSCDGEVMFGGKPAVPPSENRTITELRSFTSNSGFSPLSTVHIRHGTGVLWSSSLIFRFFLLSYIILVFYGILRGLFASADDKES